jgi:hypothetical protein
MAHLHCVKDNRRVLVFKDAVGHVVVVHRADGKDCETRYVRIGRYTYDPHLPTTLSVDVEPHKNRIGAIVAIEDLTGLQAEAVERVIKSKRMTRKQRKRAPVSAMVLRGKTTKFYE